MELSTPHSDQPPLLLGLAIFQHLHKLEYVRSIHLVKKGWYIHSIQQEFSLSKGLSNRERSAPTHLACLYNEDNVKAHMDMVRAKQESESWKCLLDFCTSPPRNFHLETTVANVWEKANALFMNASDASEDHSINWEQPKCIVQSLPTILQNEKPKEHKNHYVAIECPDTTSQRPQLDLWQQWGSDLGLASPRISQGFDSPLLKNYSHYTDMASCRATTSSMSSSLSVDSSFWTHKPLVPAPRMLLNVMEEPHVEYEVGRSATGFGCSHISPHSETETILRESSMMSFEYGMTQPISSTSVTCSSSDERSLEAVNSGAPEQLKDNWRGGNGCPNAKELMKFKSSRAASGRMTELTKEELTHYFNMPITQASKELKVGLTVLKKRCRIFGIPRWPHRKMKSINSLINNIQDLSKGDGDTDNDINHVQGALEELNKQKKEMQESPGIQLAERTKRLRQACFKANYRKRRQTLNDLPTIDRVNAAINSSNSNSSTNSSCSDSVYHYCEFEPELPSVQT